MKTTTVILISALVAGCAMAPISKRDIVATETGTEVHRALWRACDPLGDIKGVSMAASYYNNTRGDHNAKQALLNGAPAETTHVAYSTSIGLVTTATGEAFRCPEGFRP